MKILKITDSSKEGTLPRYFNGWLNERFGECYAQLSVQTTLKLKQAVKDVARAMLGLVPRDIEDWCKRFETPPQGLGDINFIMGWTDDEGSHQGSIERDQALQAYVAKYPTQWSIVKNAISLPRQMSRHASAFVVASKPISDFIPITSISGVKVTAFSGPEVEAVGGLKMDWLVISVLLDIQKCLSLIKERNTDVTLTEKNINGRLVPAHRLVLDPVTTKTVDIWDLPSDINVFKDISTSKTETVFQFNTPSAVQWLKNFDYTRPDGTPGINSIEAMAAFTALDRPGPLNFEVSNPDNTAQKHNILVEYARRVRGLKGSPDIIPVFDKLLPETYSLIIYQESLQKVYQELTECSGSEAEEFRSFAAKKKPEKMAKAYAFFVDKVTPKLGKEQTQQVWDSLVTFAEYGFNKSHATSYVIISYACAWLKHYYPLEWWCAVLQNATKEEISEKFWPYVKDIVKLPDINTSKGSWTIVDDKIQAPISVCYGIGESAHNQISKHAPYLSLDDFCEKTVKSRLETGEWKRSPITIGTIRTLIVAGVMDSLFDKNFSLSEKLDQYQKLSKKYVIASGKKYVKPKTNYTSPDSLGLYQMKKDILPIYSEDIRPFVNGEEFTRTDGKLYYNYMRYSFVDKKEVAEPIVVVGACELADMESAIDVPNGGYMCAVVGHIEDKSTFSYQKNTKTAKKFLIDACGFKRSLVYWPDKEGDFPSEANVVDIGAIVVAMLSRSDLKYGFSIRKIKQLRGPIKKEESENE